MNSNDNSIRVLLIEDNPGDVRLIREMLQEAKGRKIVLEHCATLIQGLQALSKNDFDILLLDLTLPDSIGFDTFVKVYTQNPQIPIIVLTGLNDEELAIKSVRTGAQDYLVKGRIDSLLLSRSISYAIERAGLLRAVQQELIERKAMESTLRKVNRALQMLSECNEIVVRATDERSLAEKICSAIITFGEYPYAWIVVTEPDDEKPIQPIAIAGSKDCHSLEEASDWFMRATDSPLNEALRTGKVFVCDDVMVDKCRSNLKIEADKPGYRSFVVLPLVAGEKILGVVQICSQEPNRFDHEELKLLEELKEDVSYAIVSIRTQKERKQAEEKLKISEEKYRSIFENVQDVYYETLQDGTILEVSPSIEFMSKGQYGRSDLLGKSMFAFYQDINNRHAIIEALQKKGSVSDFEIQLKNRDGSIIVCSISAKLIFNVEGQPIKIIGSMHDITERKNAEAALQESEEKFRRLFEDHTAVKLLIDPDSGDIIDANNAAAVYYGWSSEELKRMKIDQINTLTPEEVKKEMEKAISQKRIQFEFKHRRKDGSIRDVEVFSSKIAVGNKNMLHSIVHDITNRKKVESALKESEEIFNQFLANSPVLVYVKDEQCRFKKLSKSFEQLFGKPTSEMIDKDLYELLPTELAKNVFEDDQKVLKEGIGVHVEEKLNNRVLTSIKFPIHRGSGKPDYLGGFSIDITEHKQMEEGLRQMQKLEGLGTLAGGIAHDFNNILGIILAYITSTKRFKDDPTKLDLAVDTIVKAVERGKTLVQQILMFARKTETSQGAVNVNDIVMEVVNMIYEMFPRNVTCSQNFDKSIPWINADRSQLHQVLMNLCVNARDAMPKGGILGINTRMVSVASLRAQHPNADESSYVCIEVSDTGEGMTEETRKRIFEPFFTTKDIGKGTGLGLSVVFGVIQAHKGFIDVESELDKGTTFRFYLPVSQAAVPMREIEEKTLEEMLGGTETLLIVEDEEMLLMSLQIVLVEKGYKILSAKDGLNALKIYEEKKNEISLVLTDLGLPKMNGMEVCQRIKTINPDENFILATGYLEPEMKTEFLKAGIQHFLYKPYDLTKVLKVIREVLDEK